MFKRLRLWYWKWFRPSKYYNHVGRQAVAGLLAGFNTVGAASKKFEEDLQKITQAVAALLPAEAEKEDSYCEGCEAHDCEVCAGHEALKYDQK